jgi:predicted SAM-dependent methyltransferase
MREASKAMGRRSVEEYGKFFVGDGIDVGCGPDPVDKWKDKFIEMGSCKHWDMEDGDAEKLSSIPYNKYNWLHSSHSLEHMRNWDIALRRWTRVVRSGGYIIVVVPSWEMYEHKIWPSENNDDHKWAFTLDYAERGKHIVNLNHQMLSEFGEVIMLNNLTEGYDPDLKGDQTLGSAECAIEFILQRR